MPGRSGRVSAGGNSSLCLVVVAVMLVGCAHAAGNIGCLFSNTLCENEWCFDDYAFGRCFPVKANLKEDDLTRYHLGEDELHVLEAEMQRLYHLGYRWSHTYTQCVLQALLKAIHESTEFDVTSCNDELDQDLEGALRAIEGEEQEAVSPRDLAIVRFTPSATDPHSDYADEFYFPAIEGGKLLPAPFRELPPLDGDKLNQSDLSNATSVKASQGKSQKVIGESLFNDTPDSSSKSKEKPHDLKTVQGGSNVNIPKQFYGGKADRPAIKATTGNMGSPPMKSSESPKASFNSQPYSANYFDVSPMERQLLSGVDFQKTSPYDYSGMQRAEFMRNQIYPKKPYAVNAAKFPSQSREYLVDPGYSMDGFLSDGVYPGNGFMGDQPIPDDSLGEAELDFLDRSLNSKFPDKPRKMSNKEYLKQHLNFPVRDYDEYEELGYDPGYEKSLYGGRSKSRNPLYRKRSSKSQRFNLRNFLNEFNDYVKAEREKTKHTKKDMRNRTAVNTSNVALNDASFPGHIDPELRKDFMSFAENVMRKDRYGDVKPQYNTAELKKLAAIIDELRTIQQGPHDNNNPLPRPLDRSELQPVYAKPLGQRGKTESSQNEIADYYPDTNNGAYLRVDKAIPYGSPSQYPVHPRPHIDRYAYAPYKDDFKQPEEAYLGTQDTAGGEQGYYHQGQVPTTDLYYKGQQAETFYPAYGPAYDYHRNSIDSQFPDTPVPLDEDPYDTYKDGFGLQTKFPFFYLPDGSMYDYPMYEYATSLDGTGASASDDPDSANFVKKDEETADSEYGTIMGAEGKPLPYNFERPERVDVKKPGPNFYPKHYASDNQPLDYYDHDYDLNFYATRGKIYDNYTPYYFYNDPYPNYDMEDVDTVGGADSGEGGSDGNYPNDSGDKGDQRVRYLDANGNAIDIGLATGRGGMIPMVQDTESAGARFSQLLRKQGLKGSPLHPGTNLDRLMRLHHPARLPDLLLTDEMVVDNVSRGLANPHHAKMMNRPHGMHPGRLPMDMGQGRSNQSSTEGEGVTHPASLPPPSPTYVYVDVNMSFSSLGEASDLASLILDNAGLSRADIRDLRVEDNRMLFTLSDNLKGVTEQDIADKAQELAPSIQRDWNVLITRAGVASSQGEGWSVVEGSGSERRLMVGAAVVSGVMAAAVVAAAGVLLLRRHAAHRNKLRGFTNRDSEASKDYQDLCRARMAAKNKSVHGSGGDKDGSTGGNVPGTHTASKPRIASLSKESDNGGNSPGSRSSTSSWSEEPVAPNMDISTGHMVLSYMEDHLQNKSRLDQEWVALCAYEAEPSATMVAKKPTNQKKNRYPAVLPYDHNRVHLNQQANISGSDYINASSITDHDPRNPAYIATQGPLATTTADFWQLVWEQGSVVIVMLTKLNENGHTLCHHYWPQEGSQLYHIYEVHLVSEHIWCDDYLVRSFYLKNTRTGETRTVTQFHFLSWPDTAIPVSTKALLEFRRKVNKSYRGRSCPIIVHCSDGIGRSGTYILIDMVLNRMAKGAKEIDIAATLEHIRDQRANMVATKLQFEFVLMAVAEEVHAILKALPQ